MKRKELLPLERGCYDGSTIMGRDGKMVAKAESIEWAELFCIAVNSHDALLAACDDLRERLLAFVRATCEITDCMKDIEAIQNADTVMLASKGAVPDAE